MRPVYNNYFRVARYLYTIPPSLEALAEDRQSLNAERDVLSCEHTIQTDPISL